MDRWTIPTQQQQQQQPQSLNHLSQATSSFFEAFLCRYFFSINKHLLISHLLGFLPCRPSFVFCVCLVCLVLLPFAFCFLLFAFCFLLFAFLLFSSFGKPVRRETTLPLRLRLPLRFLFCRSIPSFSFISFILCLFCRCTYTDKSEKERKEHSIDAANLIIYTFPSFLPSSSSSSSSRASCAPTVPVSFFN